MKRPVGATAREKEREYILFCRWMEKVKSKCLSDPEYG